MFSTAQQAYIDAILPTYAKEGYKYYVVYTDNVAASNYYGSAGPDLYAIFSKSEIIAKDGYTYDIEGDALKLSIRSSNYTGSSSSNNSDRVTLIEYSENTLTVPGYEHIYTNATFTGYTLQPDYTLQSGGEINVRLEALTISLLAVVFFVALRKLWFGKR